MSVFAQLKGALLASLVALPSVAQAQAAADPDCWRVDEVDAARFEDFRLRLMVGALNCKNYMPTVAQTYNGFMQGKKEFILANLYVVRAHFVREAGAAEGATAFANYETLAGNKYSTTIYDRAKCETIDAYTRIAAASSDADLARLVGALSPGPLPSGCKVAPRAVVAAVAPVAAPVAAPAPAVVAAPAIATPITEAASTAATRRLIASRAAARSVALATTPIPVAAPAPAAVAAVPAGDEGVEPAVIPASLLIAEAKPTPAPEPVKPVAAVPAVQPVATAAPAIAPPAVAAATAAPATVSPGASQALADAVKALAAAVAAMQQPSGS